MEIFQTLGDRVHREWRSASYDEARFPEIAREALESVSAKSDVECLEMMKLVLGCDNLPEQVDIRSRFGDPPVTVYRGPGFHVDLLFWTISHTDIHQHGFSGAFQMLDGSSLHCTYGFDPHQRIQSRMRLGELSLERMEVLERGAVRAIHSGDRFIHSNYHLGRPSLSLVIRTLQDPASLPQLSYRPPYLAVEPADRYYGEFPLLARQLQVLSSIYNTRKDAFFEVARGYLATASTFEATIALLEWAHFGRRQLLDELWPDARARFEAADQLEAVLYRRARESVIKSRLHLSNEAEHQLFLALLLAAPGRSRIDALLEERYPDPSETLTRWIRELSTGDGRERVLRFTVDDAWADVVRAFLETRSLGGTIERLKATHGDEVDGEAPAITEFVALVRDDPMLGALFDDSGARA